MNCGLWVVALCALSAETARAQRPRPVVDTDSRTIVFVCEHGTVKSVLALAYFSQLSRQRGLSIRAVSRGTAPDTAIPAFMLEGLKRDGLDIGRFTPTRFTEHDLASALAVVSFDQPAVATVVAGRLPTIAWDKLPSVTANYSIARDAIKRRVEALVDSLARTHRAPRPR